jgi:hypothetical protein
MLWICRECGAEVAASDQILVVTIGWTALDGDTGVCSPCVRRSKGDATTGNLFAQRTRRVIETSERAVSLSRMRVERARRQSVDAAPPTRLPRTRS